MIEWNALLALGVALAISVAVPGPGIAAVVARALASGLKTTTFMIPGIMLGDLIYLTLAVFGLALIAQTFATLFLILKLAGAAYLIYLAWTFWTSPATDFTKPSGQISEHASDQSAKNRDEEPLRVFMSAFLITMGNPKAIAFYMALLPTFIDLTQVSISGYLTLVVLDVSVIGVIIFAYAALAARMRSVFTRPGPQKLMYRGAAAVMIGAALSIASR